MRWDDGVAAPVLCSLLRLRRVLKLTSLCAERSADLMSVTTTSIASSAGKWLSTATLSLVLVASQPALARESVFFPSLDSPLTGGKPTLLRGLLMKPEGVGPFPAIVALHGCNGLLKEGALVAREAAWTQHLTSHGYVVLFPDSFGPRDVTSDCEGRVRAWAERSYDAYGGLRYLQAQPFVLGERIGLMGWSHGGGTVVFAIDWKPDISFLLEIGAQDDSIQSAPCIERTRSARAGGAPMQMKVYDGAVHDFDWPGDKLHTITSPSGKVAHYGVDEDARGDALVRVLAFFESRLKP